MIIVSVSEAAATAKLPPLITCVREGVVTHVQGRQPGAVMVMESWDLMTAFLASVSL